MDRQLNSMTAPFLFSDEVASEVSDIASVPDRLRRKNELLRERFEADVVKVQWHRVRKGDVFVPPSSKRAIVVGSVTWNRDDLATLAKLASSDQRGTEIYVFNLDDVQSEDDLKRFMPGVPLPTKTPVIAEYIGGSLTKWAIGSAAQDVVE
jgi:hypothetical protein